MNSCNSAARTCAGTTRQEGLGAKVTTMSAENERYESAKTPAIGRRELLRRSSVAALTIPLPPLFADTAAAKDSTRRFALLAEPDIRPRDEWADGLSPTGP